MTNPQRLLTKRAFRAWLETRKPLARVGEVGNYFSCPLANFARSVGLDVEGVGPDTIRIAEQRYDLKHWQLDFVDRIDDAVRARYVTAKRALEALR